MSALGTCLQEVGPSKTSKGRLLFVVDFVVLSGGFMLWYFSKAG